MRRPLVGGVWALALLGAALAAGGTRLRGRAPAAARRLGHEEIDDDYYYDNVNDGFGYDDDGFDDPPPEDPGLRRLVLHVQLERNADVRYGGGRPDLW